MAYFEINKKPPLSFPTLTGSIVTFNSQYAGLPLSSCTSLISGYQEGSGTPSPDNVRPLHAWDKARLFDTQKNLFDMNSDKITGAYISSTGAIVYQAGQDIYTEKIYIKPSTQYTISGKSDTNAIIRIALYSANNSFIGRVLSTSMQNPVVTITPTSQASYFIVNPDITITDIQAEEGQQATAYEPFGNTYTFTFGQSIYQGSIDWKRGVVTTSMGVRVFDGSSDENWRTYSGQRYTIPVSDFTSPSSSQLANIMCDKLKTITKVQQGSKTFVISGSDANSHDFMVNVGANTYTDMINWLNENPITVAYELATPITIQLSPCPIDTLLGENNIWADTGDTTLQYPKFG